MEMTEFRSCSEEDEMTLLQASTATALRASGEEQRRLVLEEQGLGAAFIGRRGKRRGRQGGGAVELSGRP
jgi:hypothetical protein